LNFYSKIARLGFLDEDFSAKTPNVAPANIKARDQSGPFRASLKGREAVLIVSASETDANMLYATSFFAPDPFILLQYRGRKCLVMSDLEIDRAKKQAEVDQVLSLSLYQVRLRKIGTANPTTVDIVEMICHEKGIGSLAVPANFPALLADELRSKGFVLQVRKDPFFAARERKKAEEVKKIRDSLRVAELGLDAGIQALKKAKIGRNRYLYLDGSRLTSERLKTIVNTLSWPRDGCRATPSSRQETSAVTLIMRGADRLNPIPLLYSTSFPAPRKQAISAT